MSQVPVRHPSFRRALATVAIAGLAAVALGVGVPSSATADPPPTTTTTLSWLCQVLNIGCPTTTTTTVPTTTTTAPTTTTTTPPTCGGIPTVAKPGGGTWSCTFSDEFNGSTLDLSKWQRLSTDLTGTTHGPACITDSPNNAQVDGAGALVLTAREEAAPVTCHGETYTRTSGEVSTFQRFDQAFGRWEIRAKISPVTVPGLHSAIWLWPTDTSKYGDSSEEIDIAEMYSRYPDRAIPFIHYNTLASAFGEPVTNNYALVPDMDEYHTYVLEWTTTHLIISYDGTVILNHRIRPAGLFLQAPKPFDHPFFLTLTQGLGVPQNAFEPGVTPLPATTLVDYVRIWG